MDYLGKLENQSIYILREAFNKFENLAMLWSIGKDSTVLLWLARKAFFGHVPFPLVHVDTTYKIPLMIEYRDRLCKDWNLQLVVGRNEEVLKSGVTYPNGRPRASSAAGRSRRTPSNRCSTSTILPALSSASAATRSPPAPRSVTSARATRTWSGMSRSTPRIVGPVQDRL